MTRGAIFCLPVACLLIVQVEVSALTPSPSLNALVHDSDRIVRGKVVRSESRMEEVAVNPRGDHAALVLTYLTIQPIEHIKGQASDEVVLRLMGGYWRGHVTVASSMPSFALDEEVVLFLKEADRPGRDHAESVCNLSHGVFSKFRVGRGGGSEVVTGAFPTRSLMVPIQEGVGDNWIGLAKMRQLIEAEEARGRVECSGCDRP